MGRPRTGSRGSRAASNEKAKLGSGRADWAGRVSARLLGGGRCRHLRWDPQLVEPSTEHRIRDRAQSIGDPPFHLPHIQYLRLQAHHQHLDMSLEQLSSNKVFDGQLVKYKFKVRLAY